MSKPVGALRRSSPMARHNTTMEVQAPRLTSTQALLGITGAIERPLRPGRPYHVVGLGQALAIALWMEDQQLMVITVHEDDSALPFAAALFARLATGTRSFEIRRWPR